MSAFNLPTSGHGVEFETSQALADAQQIVAERGAAVTIQLRREANVERDQFNSIKSRSTTESILSTRAFPVRHNPTEKYLEKVGLREKSEVVIHTAMQDWLDAGYDMTRLKELDMIRMTVVLDLVRYEIKEKNFFSQFRDTYLYVVIGMNRI